MCKFRPGTSLPGDEILSFVLCFTNVASAFLLNKKNLACLIAVSVYVVLTYGRYGDMAERGSMYID